MSAALSEIEDRREHLTAMNHAREADCEVEIACRRDGTILGLRGEVFIDLGAYIRTNGLIAPRTLAQFFSGPYRVPDTRITSTALLTNKTPAGTFLYRTTSATSSSVRSVDRRRRCAVTIPASATRPVHGTSRDEWWPRSSGTPASFIRASASSSPTWRPAERVVAFYNHRGTCEQYIKEGKGAIKWTRLSCRSFAANAVRLQLHALAYNLGNFMRTLAMPKTAEPWSLTSLREKLIKIGAKVVSHGRYVTFQMAEVAVPRQMLAEILSLIARLQAPPAPA
jgi:hypothetical protein